MFSMHPPTTNTPSINTAAWPSRLSSGDPKLPTTCAKLSTLASFLDFPPTTQLKPVCPSPLCPFLPGSN